MSAGLPATDVALPARATVGRLSLAPAWRWAHLGALSVLLLFVSTYLIVRQGDVLQSPDETSNRIFTETFGQNGELWYQNELTRLDEENLLHPRGVLTHDDRAVPFNFLGLPVAYGAVFAIGGSTAVTLFGVGLSLATAVLLWRAAALMFGARGEDAFAVILGCTPLLYYFNRPYMNALPAIAFFSAGAWLLARYARRPSARNLVLVALALSTSMFFRYEYMLLGVPLLVLAALLWRGDASMGKGVMWLGLAALVVLAVFVGPVLVLNEYVYGDWRTYGYSLFNDAYYPDRGGAGDGILSSAQSMLFTADISPREIARNLFRFTFLLAPIFTLLAVGGLWSLVRRRSARWVTLAGIGGLALFFLCYRGSSDTWGAAGTAPTFDAAIVRYWLPLYVGMALLASLALTRVEPVAVRNLVGLVLATTAAMSILWSTDGNLSDLATGLREQEQWSENVALRITEENAVIYAGRSDKRIVPYRYAASWWNGAEFYDPALVARSMARVYALDRPAYIRKEREVDIGLLNEHLATYWLVATPTSDKALFRVQPLPPP